MKEKEKIEKKFIDLNLKHLKGKIKLNVGGYRFETSRSTFTQYPESMLETLVSGRFNIELDDQGYIFIDRDGKMFKYILNALRNKKLVLPQDFTEYDLLSEEISKKKNV